MTALALARTWADTGQRVRYSASGWVRLGTVVDWDDHNTALVRFDGEPGQTLALPVGDLTPEDAVAEQVWVDVHAVAAVDLLDAAQKLSWQLDECPGTPAEQLAHLGRLLEAIRDHDTALIRDRSDADVELTRSDISHTVRQLVHGSTLVCADCMRLADDPSRVRLAVTAGPVPQCAYHAGAS